MMAMLTENAEIVMIAIKIVATMVSLYDADDANYIVTPLTFLPFPLAA